MTITCMDYADIDRMVAEYLHANGIVQDPSAEQQTVDDRVAVFLRHIPDSPDHCVGLAVISENRDLDDANPEIGLLVVMRTAPWNHDQLSHLAAKIFTLLHDASNYRLTATQRVLLSRRTVRGPVVQDKNRRWQRADTYHLRLLVPNS